MCAPARVFRSQEEFVAAYDAGLLQEDMVAVVTHQGPQANGMPELHKLSPYLGVLQNKGKQVALLTDGRMSGASGKILAAIHVTPEASDGGLIGRIEDGDLVTVDADSGVIEVAANLSERVDPVVDLSANQFGMGRELFANFRQRVSDSAHGASVF